jgi:MFS transporter, DHA1 family, multidrug resistance protein
MGGVAIFSSTMSKNPALPLFIRSLGVPDSTIGFIAAASTVVGIVVSLPAGVLSDWYGRRRVLLASMVVFASAPFLYLLVRSPWQLVAVRIYHGLATAILGPVALASVAALGSPGRGEKMAWYSSATLVGRFLAPTVGGMLIAGSDFRWVYVACGFAGIIALLLALSLPSGQEKRTANQARDLGGQWQGLVEELDYIRGHRGILLTSVVEAAQYFAFGFLEVYLPLRLTTEGFKTWQIGPLFTIQVLSITVSKPWMGRLGDRWGRTKSIVAGLLLDASALLIVSAAHTYPMLVLGAALFGLGMAAVTASTAALVSELARKDAYGAALGVLSSIMDVGQSTGPMVGGLIVGASGYGAAFLAVALVLVLTSVVFYVTTGRG